MRKRKLSKSDVKAFLVSNEIWQRRKQEKIKDKREKYYNQFDFHPEISERS